MCFHILFLRENIKNCVRANFHRFLSDCSKPLFLNSPNTKLPSILPVFKYCTKRTKHVKNPKNWENGLSYLVFEGKYQNWCLGQFSPLFKGLFITTTFETSNRKMISVEANAFWRHVYNFTPISNSKYGEQSI